MKKIFIVFLLLLIFCITVPAPLEAVTAPYPQSSVISDIQLTTSTYKEMAVGSDNFPTTWGANGHVYTSWGDGGGFGGTNNDGRVSLGFGRIEGTPPSISGYNIYGGKNPQCAGGINGKSYGIIDISGTLYAWISPGSNNTNYQKATLYKSTNLGCSWSSTGVEFTQSQNLILPSILQHGSGYTDAPDSYVYSYATRLKSSGSLTIQKPGEIDLMRVPKASITDRNSYEFYSGAVGGGSTATWTKDVNARKPVFTVANGVGWAPAVVSYNKGLNRYLLAVDDAASGVGGVSGKGVGFYEAPSPWGPWSKIKIITTFNYEPTFFYNFPTKWISSDGKTLWLVFSGTGDYDSFNIVKATLTTGPQPSTQPSPSASANPSPSASVVPSPSASLKPSATPSPTPCPPGDSNCDGVVDASELKVILGGYLTPSPDLTGDAKVNSLDISLALKYFGTAPSPANSLVSIGPNGSTTSSMYSLVVKE